MDAVFLRHNLSAGPGSFPGILERLGMSCRTVNAVTADLAAFDALAPELLVVLGGSPGMYQKGQYPFLKEEMKIVEKRLSSGRKLIGICLGAQMMAEVAGAKVYKGSAGFEKGWQEITATEAGQKTPVSHFGKDHTRVLQWHGDTFDLPRGAALLATGDMYPNQIFSLGRGAIGFQPHIEATPEIALDWGVDLAYEAGTGNFDPASWREQTEKYAATLQRRTELFVKDWVFGSGATGFDKAEALG